MQAWAYKFYSSTAWKKCRKAYNKLMHYQCEDCSGVGEIVHHKTPLTPDNINDPNISLNFDNLRLVCRKCHAKYDGNAATVEGVFFDADGNLDRSPHQKTLYKGFQHRKGYPP